MFDSNRGSNYHKQTLRLSQTDRSIAPNRPLVYPQSTSRLQTIDRISPLNQPHDLKEGA